MFLDATGWVQLRNPLDAGGAYYCFNALMTHVACFGAAALYSAYSTIAANHESHSNTGGNYMDNHATNNTVFLPANDTAAEYPGPSASKIDDVTLFAAIGTLSAVWTIAFVGLLLTMKREYVGSFVSWQTGCAYSRAHFLDHQGNDARRVFIFFINDWHWRSIRDLVRQWVLSAYASWLHLSPAWLCDALRAAIPDDFMPAPVVQELDAQSPGGRRRTLTGMGAARRMTLAFAGVEHIAESAGGSSEAADDSEGQYASAAADGWHVSPAPVEALPSGPSKGLSVLNPAC